MNGKAEVSVNLAQMLVMKKHILSPCLLAM